MSADPASLSCPHLYVVGDTECRLCLHELEGMALTDQNDDGVDWGEVPSGASQDTPYDEAVLRPDGVNASRMGMPAYPEYPPLQEAPISINFKVTGEPMITVRGFDAHQITSVLNDLEDGGVWANIASAQASLRVQGQVGGILGPVTPVSPMAPPQGPMAGPPGLPQAGPPFGPNVSVPSAPGYMQPQQSYQSGPPQQQNWQGGGGGYGGGNNRAEPKPQPPGWMRVNARTGPGFDSWKQMRDTYKDDLKGKVQWGGKSDYWIEPSIGQWVASMGFSVTP